MFSVEQIGGLGRLAKVAAKNFCVSHVFLFRMKTDSGLNPLSTLAHYRAWLGQEVGAKMSNNVDSARRASISDLRLNV